MMILLLLMSAAAHAAPNFDLPLMSSYTRSSEPLTTEKIWDLDPEEKNPHRVTWVLERNLALKDLKAKPERKSVFGIQTSGLVSQTVLHLRSPDGPSKLFQDYSKFPCTPNPKGEFTTPVGSGKAADEAARIWEQMVDEGKFKLAAMLRNFSADSPVDALFGAKLIFDHWLRDLQVSWRKRAFPAAREVEWAFYRKDAKDSGLCSIPTPPLESSIEQRMEPPAATPSAKMPLVQIPARRWNGLYTVNVALSSGGATSRKLIGQFIIDSAAPVSVLSPDWLDAQGLPANWIEEHQATGHLEWSLPYREEQARTVKVAHFGADQFLLVSNLKLPLTDFLIAKTNFFEPPSTAKLCCDGVLGNDFLRSFSVELRSFRSPFASEKPREKFAEVLLWPREGFRPEGDVDWVETSFPNEGNAPVSECRLDSDSPFELTWATGDTGSLVLPPSKGANREKSPLSCGSLKLGETDSRHSDRERSEVGMRFLAKDHFFFDLPHGRIWFPKGYADHPILQNNSGLDLLYRYEGPSRVLEVKDIRPESPASTQLAGIRHGTRIYKLNGFDAEDLDQWEVEQMLAGAQGKLLSVQWGTTKGMKVAPLVLK